MRTRVIGVGSAAAGDDGVGLAVVDALRRAAVPDGMEVVSARDPTALVDLLDGVARVVLVDAVLGAGPAGHVVILSASALGEHEEVEPLSTHGVDLRAALALADVIHPRPEARAVWLVGVCVDRVERGTVGLSPEVSAAVPRAVAAILECHARACGASQHASRGVAGT